MTLTQSLNPAPLATPKGTHAVVVGGSMAGLLTARVLTDHFDQVTIVERDRLPDQPMHRQGVPQANHVHVLLTQGQRILEQFFPGIEAELAAAGTPIVDWTADCPMLGMWGWEPRFRSNLVTRTCSRSLLEWLVRRRLADRSNLQVLQGYQVTGLIRNASQISGVRVRPYAQAEAATDPEQALASDLVIDASGRSSQISRWLAALGLQPAEETVINSHLGYASRWYQKPPNLNEDWKALLIASKPPDCRRAGVLFPIEGDRWIITLSGIGRDYPPTDDAGFLEFAQSLRSPAIYNAIKHAQPLSPVYSYRATENRLHHYDKRRDLPDGLILIGDTVCAFNPIYGQGMTTASLGALTLDQTLRQRRHNGRVSVKGLTRYFQRQLARNNETPWLMATGEDFRWDTTDGGKPDWITRLMHRYLDQVLLLSVQYPQIYRAFAEVSHMVQPPQTLFRPDILALVLKQTFSGTSYSNTLWNSDAIPALGNEGLLAGHGSGDRPS